MKPGYAALAATGFLVQCVFGYTLTDSNFTVVTGANGEISSLKITGDTFPTEYVFNASNSSNTNGWVGELIFNYRLGGTTAWTRALTSASGDVRRQSRNGDTVTVTYEASANAQGIRNFRLVETYALGNGCLSWRISLTNTSTQSIEFGDIGMPLYFNERWPSSERIYETRTVTHSYTGNNGSFIYAQRPSGVGPYVVMIPDATTGAGWEYQDIRTFYIHSNVVKSGGRGYLPTTSLTLSAGQTKVYGFKFFKVANLDAMKDVLYRQGLVDVNVVPGLIVPTNMTIKLDLHTQKTISSVTAAYPAQTSISYIATTPVDHKIYQITLGRLGQNNITVNYGTGEKMAVQFWAVEPIDAALQRHATFMVDKMQVHRPGKVYHLCFDDWMMDSNAVRNKYDGYWGWGDDWGYPHGEFLAEKNVLFPVASEVQALDAYLDTCIWQNLMDGHHTDFLIHDFIDDPPPNNEPTYRGYAYPHIYNTFYAMYRIAKLHPDIIPRFLTPRDTLLYRTSRILRALYSSGVYYNWSTGIMGEHTTPDIIRSLQEAGMTSEASAITSIMATKYNNFRSNPYPYGSEYAYDNTGEEGCYTLAKMNNDTEMMQRVVNKSMACRGMAPVWYFYVDPVTGTGETWWNFQYTTALAGYCLDDWARNYSATPERDIRYAYAAKIALIAYINSGQIDSDPEDIGASSWTYQSQKGTSCVHWVSGGALHNGWWQMTGESDLGLFGAIRIISADVADDPIFGLFGYGCDVTQNGNAYSIIPKDGIFKRLNMVSLKLSMALEQDQYTSAIVRDTKNYVEFNLKNMKTAAHTTTVTVSGLSAGPYDVRIDNVVTGNFTATTGTSLVVNLAIGTNAAYNIKIMPQGSGVLSEKNAQPPERYSFSAVQSRSGILISYHSFDKGGMRPSLSLINLKGERIAYYHALPDGTIRCKPGCGLYLVLLEWADGRRVGQRLVCVR